MNLKELENTNILLLGKSRAFVVEEFDSLMKYNKINVVKKVQDDVTLVVEGRMLTPYEQNDMAELYELGKYEFISIDELESTLASEIDSDMLLMSLKLSHDKERLKSFIQNSKITDELFFKLIKMYSWSNEDFFENDDNRDVSAAFISRFYENIERNHNVQYATTGFIHLVAQAKSSDLLKAISELEPMQFHPKINAAIAMSIYLDEAMQERFYKRKLERIDEALSFNKKLKHSLIEIFLEDEDLGANVAKSIELDEVLFEKCKKYSEALALNETLSIVMQKELLSENDKSINFALSHNSVIDESVIVELLKTTEKEQLEVLYENSAMPVELLEEAYNAGVYNASLSKNEATPVEILYQLQLDSRYERSVKTNAAFGKHITSENIGWL